MSEGGQSPITIEVDCTACRRLVNVVLPPGAEANSLMRVTCPKCTCPFEFPVPMEVNCGACRQNVKVMLPLGTESRSRFKAFCPKCNAENEFPVPATAARRRQNVRATPAEARADASSGVSLEPPRSQVLEDLDHVVEDLKQQLLAEIPNMDRRAFLRLLRVWHPDKNIENTHLATEIFQFLTNHEHMIKKN